MKHLSSYLSAIVLMASAVTTAAAADGIEMNHLSTTNTLVRVNADARYLLLPVQESIDDARVNVLVDGNLTKTIYVRLAKSKTDFFVPFDLTPYRGHKVVLDVVTDQSRSSVREAKAMPAGRICASVTLSTPQTARLPTVLPFTTLPSMAG